MLLHVSLTYSFLLPSTVPQYICTEVCLSIHHLIDLCFQFWATISKAAKHSSTGLCVNVLFLLGRYLGMGLLGPMVSVCLTL